MLWYDYVGTHYKPLEAATLYSDVQHYMIPAMVATEEGLTAFKPTPYDVNNAIRALAGLKQVHLPTGTRKPPMWLDDTPSDRAAFSHARTVYLIWKPAAPPAHA